jgi:adenine-specific DNA-methyltransferase
MVVAITEIPRRCQAANRIAKPATDSMQQESLGTGYPDVVNRYPQLRFMGSKYRLLPWIHKVLTEVRFDTAIDAFSGSGCVGYLFKAMGKQVIANDFLNLSATVAKALIENPGRKLSTESLERLLAYDPKCGFWTKPITHSGKSRSLILA